MKFTILGYRIFNYTSKRTGQTYEACNLYVSYSSDRIQGLACREFFCRASFLPKGIAPGDDIEVFFDMYGRVAGISPFSE